MRRFTGIVSLFALIATPISALALAGSPAALLGQMNFKGNPHTMEAELHMHHADTHMSIWMKGAAEGKTPSMAKAWQSFTIDIANDGSVMRAKGAVRVAHGAAYMKLLSIEGNGEMDISELQGWTTKPWVKIALPEEAMEQPSFTAGFVAGMRSAGNTVMEEDVHALLDAVADVLFTMESERYQSGVAYSLRLAPDALHRAMQAVQNSVIGKELDFDREDMDLPENLPVNLHIRVNTNTSGDLVFAKWYAATDAQGISLVMQGNTQWQNHPVYVEIPKETMPWEEFSGEWEMMDMGSMDWEMPADDWGELLEEEDDWSEDASDEDDVWENDETDMPAHQLPPRSHNWNRVPQGEHCTAAPGTPAFLQQARKGACNLPTRDNYRVNSANAATKQFKHPRARK